MKIFTTEEIASRGAWFTQDFLKVLSGWDAEGKMTEWTMFEWGAGGSTIWFGKRVKKLVSMENNLYYHNLVRDTINEQGLKNVEIFFREVPGAYASFILNYDKFDCILVDGRHRVACVEYAIKRIKPGGIIILDDAERVKYSHAHELLNGFEHFSTQDLPVKGQDIGSKTDYWIVR